MKKTKTLDLNTFGGRLKWARESARLTQKQVCQEIGIAQPTLSELEGPTSKGSSKTVQFAKLYGVSAEWLANKEGAPNSEEGVELQKKLSRLPPDRLRLIEQLVDSYLADQG